LAAPKTAAAAVAISAMRIWVTIAASYGPSASNMPGSAVGGNDGDHKRGDLYGIADKGMGPHLEVEVAREIVARSI
jgi:hypothetical protein